MRTLWQDLRYGARLLLKHPTFTIVAVLTLALGIGANSSIFTVVNAVLLRPLPFTEPERLVSLWETTAKFDRGSVSVPNLKDWREQNDVFTGIGAFQYGNFSLQEGDHPERVSGVTASANFFDLLGVRPQLGRTFLEGEDRPGQSRVVVLSDRLWRRNFGADPKVVGQTVALGGESFTVIGVMSPAFQYPSRLTDLWVPLVFTEEEQKSRGTHSYLVIARLKPGVEFSQAQEQMSLIARRLEEQYPEDQAKRGIRLFALQEDMVQFIRPALMVLLGAVGFVLLISCTNVANLLLARAAARQREIAVRMALGAGRWRLMRQFLTESLLLAVLGGALGLLLARWGVDGLLALAGNSLPRAGEVTLDWRVAGFTLLLSLLTGVGFGMAPALQVSKTDVQEALKEGGNAGSSQRRNRLRSLLVIAEVASALVLLVGAGLLIKSFMRLQEVETGMRPENVLTLAISLPEAKYPKPQMATSFYTRVLDRVKALPGVEAAAVINILPLLRTGYNGDVEIEGQSYGAGQLPFAEYRVVSQDYFRTLGIPLLRGRFFDERDREGARGVVIVNQTFVNKYLTGQDALGKRIKPGREWVEIVGVVGDVKQSGLTRPVMQELFMPYEQAASYTQSMTLVVRGAQDPEGLIPEIRREVLAVDPNLPVYNVQTMETVITKSVSERRMNMLLLTIFAGVAMLLSMVGIYSVMSYTVTQSTREIGIRMALGAQPRDVLRLVVGQGLVLALVGVLLGILGAFGLTRLMASLLYGVKATDPWTFAGVSALLLMVALLACYVPARRATKVDPMVALRYE
ncbi:MAG TPA: ABC transporter permease [Pyrinomonadaceae bacterium]|jgi:putative ABC transport system permease protein